MLAAADAAVMVLDAAKGIEPQTLKLFEVCRAPRPAAAHASSTSGTGPAATRSSCSTRSSEQIGLRADAGHLAGRHRRATSAASSTAATGEFIRFTRTARGATEAPEEVVDRRPGRRRGGRGVGRRPLDELDAARRGRRRPRPRAVPGGRVDARVLRLGAHQLRRAPAARRAWSTSRPRPSPRVDVDGDARPLDAPFSGFVFKVQANMDPSHRDRIAFVRVCSGRFERGMVVTHGRTGKPFATKYAHTVFGQERETDRGGVPGRRRRPGQRHRRRASATRSTLDEPVDVPRHPELRARALRGRPGARHRPLQAVPPGHRPARRGRRGAGAARPRPGRPGARCSPRSARCSSRWPSHRLENEFGAPVELSPTTLHASPAAPTRRAPRRCGACAASQVLARADGTLLALFESHVLARAARRRPARAGARAARGRRPRRLSRPRPPNLRSGWVCERWSAGRPTQFGGVPFWVGLRALERRLLHPERSADQCVSIEVPFGDTAYHLGMPTPLASPAALSPANR